MTLALRAVLCLTLLGCAAALQAAESMADCAGCHQKPPVPAGHMPVSEVSAEVCFTCHAVGPDDGLFVTVHEKHPAAGVDCAKCHGAAANATLQQTLDGMLGP